MASTIVRVSQQTADKVNQRRARSNRTFVAEMDLVVEAGLAALDAAEAKGTPPAKKPSSTKAKVVATTG